MKVRGLVTRVNQAKADKHRLFTVEAVLTCCKEEDPSQLVELTTHIYCMSRKRRGPSSTAPIATRQATGHVLGENTLRT